MVNGDYLAWALKIIYTFWFFYILSCHSLAYVILLSMVAFIYTQFILYNSYSFSYYIYLFHYNIIFSIIFSHYIYQPWRKMSTSFSNVTSMELLLFSLSEALKQRRINTTRNSSEEVNLWGNKFYFMQVKFEVMVE